MTSTARRPAAKESDELATLNSTVWFDAERNLPRIPGATQPMWSGVSLETGREIVPDRPGWRLAALR